MVSASLLSTWATLAILATAVPLNQARQDTSSAVEPSGMARGKTHPTASFTGSFPALTGSFSHPTGKPTGTFSGKAGDFPTGSFTGSFTHATGKASPVPMSARMVEARFGPGGEHPGFESFSNPAGTATGKPANFPSGSGKPDGFASVKATGSGAAPIPTGKPANASGRPSGASGKPSGVGSGAGPTATASMESSATETDSGAAASTAVETSVASATAVESSSASATAVESSSASSTADADAKRMRLL